MRLCRSVKIWLKTAEGQLDMVRSAGRRRSTDCHGLSIYGAPCLSKEVQNEDGYFRAARIGSGGLRNGARLLPVIVVAFNFEQDY